MIGGNVDGDGGGDNAIQFKYNLIKNKKRLFYLKLDIMVDRYLMKPYQLDNIMVDLSINLDDEHKQYMVDHNNNYSYYMFLISKHLNEDKHILH